MNKTARKAEVRIRNLEPPLASRKLAFSLYGHGGSFFTSEALMHRKASCRCINQNNVTLHGAYHQYPDGRHCKCGAKISIYNGMAQCHLCWAKKELGSIIHDNELERKLNILLVGVR